MNIHLEWLLIVFQNVYLLNAPRMSMCWSFTQKKIKNWKLVFCTYNLNEAKIICNDTKFLNAQVELWVFINCCCVVSKIIIHCLRLFCRCYHRKCISLGTFTLKWQLFMQLRFHLEYFNAISSNMLVTFTEVITTNI